jgi:hypothetical protein
LSSLDFSNIRVALVADWITDRGGAELVFDQFLALFPNADIFTSVFFREHDPIYSGRKIVTSFIQKIPFLNRRHKMALFLRPFAFRQFDFSNYDLVISSSSAESKGIRVPKNTLHICYCHTPTRYFWSHEKEYRSMMEFGFLNPLARFVFDALLDPLKKLDLEASKQPHFYIANSENTRSRIAAFYGRDSVVVPPGIDTSLYTLKREELRCPPLAGTGENSIKLGVVSISEKFACPHQPLAPSSPSSWEEGEKEEDLGKKPGFFPRSEKARRHSWSNFLGSKFFLNFIGLWAWGNRTVSEERSFV